MQKDELLKKVYELGLAYERDYRSCSQCTGGSIQDVLGMRNDFIFKASYGLAGGYANLGDGPCGGYSGGSMMISLFFGRRREYFDGDLENNSGNGGNSHVRYLSSNMCPNRKSKTKDQKSR